MSAAGFRLSKPDLKHGGGYGQSAWIHPSRDDVCVELHWNLINSPQQRGRSSVEYHHLGGNNESQQADLQSRPAAAGFKAGQPSSTWLSRSSEAGGLRIGRDRHLCENGRPAPGRMARRLPGIKNTITLYPIAAFALFLVYGLWPVETTSDKRIHSTDHRRSTRVIRHHCRQLR